MTEMWTRISRATALGLVLSAGCHAAECITQSTDYTNSVSTVGYVGPTLGKPVARFDLTQHFISHTPYAACAQGPLQDVGVVELTITSLASTPLSIAYDVQGLNASGNMMWNYASKVVRIMPNETVSVGQVAVTPVRVDLGAKVVLTAVDPVP
jgi:hypothetical protein